MEKIKTVQASNLKEARDKWAELTGETKLSTWDPIRQSVWGWSIMVISTTDQRVPKTEFFQQ